MMAVQRKPLTLHDIRVQKRHYACENARDKKRQKNGDGCVMRYVQWKNSKQKYALTKRGTRVFEDNAAINAAFLEKTLCAETDFFEFQHRDPHVTQNKTEPRRVAVFCMQDGRYLQPQAKHYKQAYRGVTDPEKWCCIHALRVKNEQRSKVRYQQRQKGRTVK